MNYTLVSFQAILGASREQRRYAQRRVPLRPEQTRPTAGGCAGGPGCGRERDKENCPKEEVHDPREADHAKDILALRSQQGSVRGIVSDISFVSDLPFTCDVIKNKCICYMHWGHQMLPQNIRVLYKKTLRTQKMG